MFGRAIIKTNVECICVFLYFHTGIHFGHPRLQTNEKLVVQYMSDI